uniref:cysteine--tRNA ligase n=1 Tax=Culicoides sonorensis TaxID=179676 RepID=A0A336M5S9_CULSO
MLRFSKSLFLISRKYCKWKQPKGIETGITVFNPITNKQTPLVLNSCNYAFWYTCGPTVYAPTHIGHASTYVRVDIIQRILKNYFNINLITAMNVTDIDDKIIKKSAEEKVSWQTLARRYENEFWNDLKLLNVITPDIKIRVSESIPLIVSFIDKLINTGFAYVAKDGSVYFRTDSFKEYGKLQKITKDANINESNKESIKDFALWKAAKNDEPFWAASWSKGRPGWHIECSAMASYIFGKSIDFHAGGLDLKFPHHENEEAQSCCFHKTDQWINYWIHTGQLKLSGQQEKMSKSLNNTISVGDLLSSCSPNEFRMLCLMSRYHSSIDFGEQTSKAAKSVLEYIFSFLEDAKAYINGVKAPVDLDTEFLMRLKNETNEEILKAFQDDFNTSKAIERLLHLISETNRSINSKEKKTFLVGSNIIIIQDIYNFVLNFLKCTGFVLEKSLDYPHKNKENSDDFITALIDVRHAIRQEAIKLKNQNLFTICDKIRKHLLDNHIELKDHGQNTSWRRKV